MTPCRALLPDVYQFFCHFFFALSLNTCLNGVSNYRYIQQKWSNAFLLDVTCVIFARATKAPAKRSQHANATFRNIVGRNMLRAFGHYVAMCWVLLAWVWKWPNLEPWPNDRNMPTQHIATLLGATCCVRLDTVLRCVGTCWVLLAQVWKWSNLSQQHPTRRNMLQQDGQMHATCCAQQCPVAICCVGMMRSFGQGLSQQHPTRRNASQHGGQTHATCRAQQCCDLLRWHVAIVWPGLNTDVWQAIVARATKSRKKCSKPP